MERLSEIVFRSMNTTIEVQLIFDRNGNHNTEEIANLCRRWFDDCEHRFSRFLPQSELNRLNRGSGSWMMVSDNLLDLLAAAERYRKLTESLFHPGIRNALEASGYSRSFEHAAEFWRQPLTAQPQRPAALDLSMSPYELDTAMKAVRLNKGMSLDLGGIAKSWTAWQLGRWLQRSRNIPVVLINAGGDAALWQSPASQELARFAIRSPWAEDESIGEVAMTHGAVATSSTRGRRWRMGMEENHHLIDPRSGKSSHSAIVQATVAGADLTACEIWAKVLCIAGAEQGLELMQRHAPGHEAMWVAADGTNQFHGRAESTNFRWHGCADGASS